MVGYGTLFYPVHISKIMIEIRIMQPHNYPTAPRQFDSVYNSACKGIVASLSYCQPGQFGGLADHLYQEE